MRPTVSDKKIKEYIRTIWKDHANTISIAASLIAIVAAIYGTIQFLDSVIEKRVKKQTEIHTELLSALFVQQTNSPYNAARRYSEIYQKSKNKYYAQDLREALVTGLLESIADSGFPEEFQNIVEQIEKDQNVSLQRDNLNAIAAIYIQLGYTEKRSIRILIDAVNRVEKGNAQPKQSIATSHWLLTLSHLSNGDIVPAVTEFLKANSLKPDSYRIDDLQFETLKDIEIYITDFPIFERIAIKNKKLTIHLLEFSKRLEKEISEKQQFYNKTNSADAKSRAAD